MYITVYTTPKEGVGMGGGILQKQTYKGQQLRKHFDILTSRPLGDFPSDEWAGNDNKKYNVTKVF